MSLSLNFLQLFFVSLALLASVRCQGFKHFPVVAGRGPPAPQRQPSVSRAISPAQPNFNQSPLPQRSPESISVPAPPPQRSSKPISVPDPSTQRSISQNDFKVLNPKRGRGRGRDNFRTRKVEESSDDKNPSRVRPRPVPTPPTKQVEQQKSLKKQSLSIPSRARIQSITRDKLNKNAENKPRSKPRIRIKQKSGPKVRPEPVKTQPILSDSPSSLFNGASGVNPTTDDRFIPEQPRFAAVPSPRPQVTSSVAQTQSTRILTPDAPTPKPVFVFDPVLQSNDLNPLQIKAPEEQAFPSIPQRQQTTGSGFAKPVPAVPRRQSSILRETQKAQTTPVQVQPSLARQPTQTVFESPVPAVPQRQSSIPRRAQLPKSPQQQVQPSFLTQQTQTDFRNPLPAVPQRQTSPQQQTLRPQAPPLQTQPIFPSSPSFTATAPVEKIEPFNPPSLFDKEIKAPQGVEGDGVYFSYEATLGGKRR